MLVIELLGGEALKCNRCDKMVVNEDWLHPPSVYLVVEDDRVDDVLCKECHEETAVAVG